MFKPVTNVDTLLEMLTYKRPAGSASEKDFIKRFIETIDGADEMLTDQHGNYYFVIGDSDTMFTSHVDSCHYTSGRQTVVVENGIAKVVDGECLGADDAAGIYIMLKMIEARVPGCFCFFSQEEVGGIGSRSAAADFPDFFKRYKRCISMDRAGYTDVITHQAGSRCASDAFAEALSAALNDQMGEEGFYMPCDGGVFTDSRNFVDLIGECSNISVAYARQHTPDETLNIKYLDMLADACTRIDWDALPYERKPGEVDPEAYWFKPSYVELDDLSTMTYAEVVKFCKQSSPDDIAEAIFELVYKLEDAEARIEQSKEVVSYDDFN